MLSQLKVMVFDMSGTTIKDYNEVLMCFQKTLRQVGIYRPDAAVNAMMGWSKITVFESLWAEELGAQHPEVATRAQTAFGLFKSHLEAWYAENNVEPTEGCLDLFFFLRQKGVKIALNTGFYRHVAEVLCQKLDWQLGRDIDFLIASDEVPLGRPHPFMLQRIMAHFGVADPLSMAKIGDTPSDIQEAKSMGCFAFGVTNGTHTEEGLLMHRPDALFNSLRSFKQFLAINDMTDL